MPVVIVTGASSGIGRATAVRFGKDGWTVVLAARRPAELSETASLVEAAGGAAVIVPTDVRDPAALEALAEQAAAITGRIDAVVNNAGVGGAASILTDDPAVTAMVEINLLAPLRLMRAVVPRMRAQGGGAIVNIGSVAGEIGLSGTYSATKFALRGLTDSVRREVAGTGIGVTLVEPGYIATPLNAGRRGLPGPEVVADAVARAVRRPRRRIVVPAKYRAAILLANALPAVADRALAGRVAPKESAPAPD
ncbi:SDR family NAD(P)-dependent oxidoreductase [Krasilnikovia sp. MM14-A1259]|uniref:SDR family NAD(P)-dependent oxidoreductase n=1 Tax=Krasilnikovia sp. MM14-A1259 TaxID=3373539 RepID=UPI0037F9DDA3